MKTKRILAAVLAPVCAVSAVTTVVAFAATEQTETVASWTGESVWKGWNASANSNGETAYAQIFKNDTNNLELKAGDKVVITAEALADDDKDTTATDVKVGLQNGSNTDVTGWDYITVTKEGSQTYEFPVTDAIITALDNNINEKYKTYINAKGCNVKITKLEVVRPVISTGGSGSSDSGTEQTGKNLWSGSLDFNESCATDDGANGIKLTTDTVGELKAGDKISVTAKRNANVTADGYQVMVQHGGWADLFTAKDVAAGDAQQFEFVLTDDLIETIKTNTDAYKQCLIIKGKAITITSVDLIAAPASSGDTSSDTSGDNSSDTSSDTSGDNSGDTEETTKTRTITIAGKDDGESTYNQIEGLENIIPLGISLSNIETVTFTYPSECDWFEFGYNQKNTDYQYKSVMGANGTLVVDWSDVDTGEYGYYKLGANTGGSDLAVTVTVKLKSSGSGGSDPVYPLPPIIDSDPDTSSTPSTSSGSTSSNTSSNTSSTTSSDTSSATAVEFKPTVDAGSADEDTVAVMNGIVVQAPGNVLDPDTVLNVKPDTTVSSDVGVAIDISFTKNGAEVQPKGDVTVSIPVPEKFKGKEVYVYHVENGKYVFISSTVANNMLTFKAGHFSTYIITDKKLGEAAPSTNPGTGVAASWAVVPAVLAAGAVVLISKKKK